MTGYDDIFQAYEQLAEQADRAFREMQQRYETCVKCGEQCSDCCHAVFGLFLVESLYLNRRFNDLDEESRRVILARADQADRDLVRVQKRLEQLGDDPQKLSAALSRERIRCPLLNDEQKCSLYPYRPVTCRVYGIPNLMGGKIQACWKAGFEKGKAYPAFDLDSAYQELYRLSQAILERAGRAGSDRASLLVSVSKSIKTPPEEITG